MSISENWSTSSFCTTAANCVEVRLDTDGMVEIRNSKDPDGPSVCFTQDEWADFLSGARKGEFDTL